MDPLKDLEAWDDSAQSDDYLIYTTDMRDALTQAHFQTFSLDGELVSKKSLGAGGPEMAALGWFPQFGMFVFKDHAVTYSWTPLTATTCHFRSTWLVHKDAVEGSDYVPEKVIEFAELLNVQDQKVCEVAQLGIESSAYRPGPYHPVFEGPVRGFNRVYLQQVG
jgi:Rieske 2Fe-2S family protein